MTSPRDADAAAPANEQRVNTANGRIFAGQMPGEDPPIVLMHGFPDDHLIYGNSCRSGRGVRLSRIRPVRSAG
jgi:pimeloyl-ACP methyl ester carboxylesterase